MANLKDVIYLSNEDYETLVSTGTVTIDGTTLTYDENCVYITPEKLASTTEDGLMSASDKIKLDSSTLNVINASDIVNNTLTQEQYDIITNGKPTRIIGGLFSIPNILLICFYETSSFVNFVYFADEQGIIQVNKNSKIISKESATYRAFNLRSIRNLNGKTLDYYLNNVYPYATNSTTELKYETINDISVSADTTFTLATAPANTYPEYKANITNSGANAITITMPSGTIIKTNDEDNIIISNNTFTLPASTSVELNYQNGNCIVFNWGI